MPFGPLLLGDVLGGFNEESGRIRTDNQSRQDKLDSQEQSAMLAIANSPDATPELRAAAVTGILTKQPGKSTGFDKWFGKHQAHPAFSSVLSMLNTPTASAGMRGGAAETGGATSAVPSPMQAPMQATDVSVDEAGTTVNDPPAAAPPMASAPARTTGAATAVPTPTPVPGRGFYAPGEREAAVAGGQLRGQINARFGAASERGITLSPADQSEIVTGRATTRTTPNRAGTLVLSDGSTVAGSVTSAGAYLDENGDPIEWSGQTVSRFVPSGAKAAITGSAGTDKNAHYVTMSAGDYVAKYGPLPAGMEKVARVQVPIHPVTQVKMGDPTPAAEPPPSFSFIPTPEGVVRGNTRSGAISTAPGGAGMGRAEPPSAGAAGLRSAVSQIETQAKTAATQFGILNQKKYTEELDKGAKARGYETYAALQKAVGDAERGVVSATPPPKAEAPKAAAPAKPAAKKPVAKKTSAATTPDDTTKAVLELLGR